MGHYLKRRREELAITQKQVADFVGVSEATVSRWESGYIANMRRDRIAKLAEVLHTTPEFVMEGSISNQPEKPPDIYDGLSDSQRALREFVKTVPEEKADLVLQVMKTIVATD